MSSNKSTNLWAVVRFENQEFAGNVRAYRKKKRADKFAAMRNKQTAVAGELHVSFVVDKLLLIEDGGE